MELFGLKLPELEKGLDVSATSCFRRIEVREHMSLLPSYIGRLADGITDHLNSKVLRYAPSLSGVLVSYSKPVVLQSFGKIFDEQPHIHFDVRYSAYVFKPTVGTILCGTVNKIGGDHVGCLVYDCFNASLITPPTPAKNGYDVGLRRSSRIGSKVWFRVSRLEVIGGILSITGEQVDFGSALGPDAAEATDLTLSSLVASDTEHERHQSGSHDELDMGASVVAMGDSVVAMGASVVGDDLHAADHSKPEHGKKEKKKKKKKKKLRGRRLSEEECLEDDVTAEEEGKQERRKSRKKRKRTNSGLEDEVKHKPKKHKLNHK